MKVAMLPRLPFHITSSIRNRHPSVRLVIVSVAMCNPSFTNTRHKTAQEQKGRKQMRKLYLLERNILKHKYLVTNKVCNQFLKNTRQRRQKGSGGRGEYLLVRNILQPEYLVANKHV